ncbi:Uncharacterised protein [Candidatus Tiddalikarchaeum anstoanum]|nr:Uncharacterised protein [Candidatus Tiddalikarchaeum anstoanum]
MDQKMIGISPCKNYSDKELENAVRDSLSQIGGLKKFHKEKQYGTS